MGVNFLKFGGKEILPLRVSLVTLGGYESLLLGASFLTFEG